MIMRNWLNFSFQSMKFSCYNMLNHAITYCIRDCAQISFSYLFLNYKLFYSPSAFLTIWNSKSTFLSFEITWGPWIKVSLIFITYPQKTSFNITPFQKFHLCQMRKTSLKNNYKWRFITLSYFFWLTKQSTRWLSATYQ